MPVAQTANVPTFESVWAMMQENALQMKELRESQKETDRVLKESKKAWDKQIGSLTNLFGDLTLGMVAPRLREKFADFGFIFLRSNLNVVFEDKKNDVSFEVDVLLENGERAMSVEVKTKITEERINKHRIRLEKMRKYADLHGDKRIFLGAVAGFAMTDNERNIVLEQGFYLIEPDGENFNITPPNGKPKEW